ncbi:unnamed protein product, partial [Discosporangium mesarthrocarpum]
SADAAATLRALSVLWGMDIPFARMSEIGLAIGADVPVCLHARPAIMSGVGETLDVVAAPPPCGVVLVNAGEAVSTPAVFTARTAPFSGTDNWRTPPTFAAFIDALQNRKNDLAEPARSVSPVIGDVLAVLVETDQCALARLSGSGGTCFGLYPDLAAAETAAAKIRTAHPDWWSVATEFREDAPSVVSC